jgi:molybdopterin converting factor small subunit
VRSRSSATVQIWKRIEVPEYYFNQVTINDSNKELNTVLSDGDLVLIWPPRIGGG